MNALVELQQRLQTLETRQRRLRIWCLASTGLWIVSCLAAVAAPWHDELRVKRLVLVDEHGAERGTLGTDEDGASLTLKSRDAKAKIVLAASTAKWTDHLPSASFIPTFPADPNATARPPKEPEHEGPWSGLVASTGDEKSPDVVTSIHAGEKGDLSIERAHGRAALSMRDDDSLQLSLDRNDGNEAAVIVDDDGSFLQMFGGEYGSWLNIEADGSGCVLAGGHNRDEGMPRGEHNTQSFGLDANDEEAKLTLWQGVFVDDGPTRYPAVKLCARDEQGSLQLWDKNGPTFHAPN